MKEDRNLLNQHFKAKPVWSISSEHGAFSDFNSWRTLANSSGEKSPKIHFSGVVGNLPSWDSSLTTSLADSRFEVLYNSFTTNCKAIE